MGSAHYQRVKITDGTADSENHMVVDSSGYALVKVGAGTSAIGKLAANSGVDIGDVDVTSISAGTNLIGKVSIDQVTANANEVVVKSALPAGTNAIGKLAANSGVDIGDVDVTSVAVHQVNASQLTSPWVTNASVVNAPFAVNASQVTSPWITNASVTNTVTTNASLVNIQQVNASQLSSPWLTNASVVNAPFSVNASQLTSPWITNASVVNAPFAVNASQLTSPWITNASVVNAPIAVNCSQTTSPWITNASVVNGVATSQVEDFIAKQTLVTNTADFVASATACAIWTPAAGKKFAITDVIVTCSQAGALTLFDNADGTGSRVAKFYMANNGGAVVNYRKPRVSSTADHVLKYTSSNTAIGSVTVQGYEV